jgi:hypothetical protein
MPGAMSTSAPSGGLGLHTMDDLVVSLRLPPGALRVEAPKPQWVSQHTAEGTLGLKRRAFLDLAAAYRADGGEVIAAGRARLVELDAFVGWLRRREAAAPSDDLGDMARACGLRLVGGDG